ncbi:MULTISPECIES: hypothetical protein [unclassified Pseudomonas]|uniref:hypothetical protein n=1 Tax=unclassified Pseudomonas TaxID=196821 RepID=UPI002B231DDA|nr:MULTISPECIES: hypothetical protein [unclassified Pseudomonas]MEB0009586.1 hypothetical protein [Pseudomonas sp. RTB2]MEB0017470.1 hypothetical protein [Pseudomonas sp. RTB3]MEB0272731.1 hypothetical protein [Pseudomonas sp. 5B4]MEE3507018.1 hypothetical protein [Pseudomonas sp. 10C3]
MSNVYGGVYGLLNPQAIDTRNLRCTTGVKIGYLDGNITCFTPSTTTKQYEENYTKGTLDGTVKFYAVDGETVLTEGIINKDLIDGDFNIYSPTNRNVIDEHHYNKESPDGIQRTHDDKTRAITSEQSVSSNISNYIKTFTPEGKPLGEITVERDGVTIKNKRWDPKTGVLIDELMSKNCNYAGPSKHGDSNGALVSNGIYGPAVINRL